MGISIWQILFLLLYVGIPVVAVASEKTSELLKRKDFAIRTFYVFILFPVFSRIATKMANTMAEDYFVIPLIVLAIYCWVNFVYAQRVVRRARDAGIRKGFCYLYAVPALNLIFVLFLMFKKGAVREPAAGAS